MFPTDLSDKSSIFSPWCYWEVLETLVGQLYRRKMGHCVCVWGGAYSLPRNTGLPLLRLFHFLAAVTKVTLLPHHKILP